MPHAPTPASRAWLPPGYIRLFFQLCERSMLRDERTQDCVGKRRKRFDTAPRHERSRVEGTSSWDASSFALRAHHQSPFLGTPTHGTPLWEATLCTALVCAHSTTKPLTFQSNESNRDRLNLALSSASPGVGRLRAKSRSDAGQNETCLEFGPHANRTFGDSGRIREPQTPRRNASRHRSTNNSKSAHACTFTDDLASPPHRASALGSIQGKPPVNDREGTLATLRSIVHHARVSAHRYGADTNRRPRAAHCSLYCPGRRPLGLESTMKLLSLLTPLALGGLAFLSMPSKHAQACFCPEPDLYSSYERADEVLAADVYFEIEVGSQRFYLVNPTRSYKGCVETQRPIWIKTPLSGSACGTQLKQGSSYLLSARKGSAPWIKEISSCGYNVESSTLSQEEQSFLDTQIQCCRGECSCANGEEIVNCLVNPCDVAPACDQGECRANYCGGCNAEFFNDAGERVCEERSCESSKDCKDDHYCSWRGVCEADNTCETDVDCNMAGNSYPQLKKCMSYGSCNRSGSCSQTCGPVECLDYQDFDFGDCEMAMGWIVRNGRCVETSGCGFPDPMMRAFPTKKQCQSSCDAK